jgi:hypothetical protein
MTTVEHLRDKLIRDSAERDWHSLWPHVMAGRAAFLLALEGISPETAAQRPGTGEGEAAWSALEVARHVLSYTRNLRAIIEETAHGRVAAKDPRGFLSEAVPADFAEVQRQLIVESMDLASLPAQLPEPPDLATTVDHAVFGPLNCRAWFLFLTIHDADHTSQLLRLKGTRGSTR